MVNLLGRKLESAFKNFSILILISKFIKVRICLFLPFTRFKTDEEGFSFLSGRIYIADNGKPGCIDNIWFHDFAQRIRYVVQKGIAVLTPDIKTCRPACDSQVSYLFEQ